jgi:flagellar basal body-associated protein FliL
MKLPIKIALIVLALAVQLVAAWFLMDWLLGRELNRGAEPDQVEAEADGEARDYEFGALFYLTDLIVNPSDSSGRRIFKISLALEYNPENVKLAAELTERAPFMRDHLIGYLGSMTEASLSDISYRETIRDSLGVALNQYLNEGKVDRVLFQDFIRQ